MIFDSDDNDDSISFDGKQPKPVPRASSLPQRPMTGKNPFNSGGDQNVAGENRTGLPARRPVPNNPKAVQRPQAPLANVQRPAPSLGSQRPSPPFNTQGGEGEAAKPSNVSSYLPAPKPVEQAPQPSEVSSYENTDVLSEAELFLRKTKEEAEQRAAAARLRELEELAAQQAARLAANVAPAPAPVEAPPTPVETVPAPSTGKKGKTKRGAAKKASAKTSNATPKEKTYDGERKKILYIRLIAGSVAAIIAVAGVQAIFLPDSGPTKEMVMSAAQEAVNYTGFPSVSGEQFAIDFSKAYFNYDSRDQSRAESLARFASPDLVTQINTTILSATEYEAVKKANEPYSSYSVVQNVTYGPYVVAVNNLDEKNSVFTVKVGLENGTIVYLDVPVKYDPDNYSLTLAGPPSFSKPIQNKGEAKKDEWTSTFENGGDEEVENAFKSDLEAYLSAWALSDSTIVNRYILDGATDNAKRGLQGSVRFQQLIDLQIEPQSDDRPNSATSRRVELNVMWEDPTNGVRYPQQYRLLIGLNQEGKWAIHDIENFSVLN